MQLGLAKLPMLRKLPVTRNAFNKPLFASIAIVGMYKLAHPDGDEILSKVFCDFCCLIVAALKTTNDSQNLI